jgi:hypothetical protein
MKRGTISGDPAHDERLRPARQAVEHDDLLARLAPALAAPAPD